MRSADRLVTPAPMTADDVNMGPRCRHCQQQEARCAWLRSCCEDCTHWLGYDHNGNRRLPSSAGGRRRLPVEHGTERGFHQHRARRELPCAACRLAHSRHVNEKNAARRTA